MVLMDNLVIIEEVAITIKDVYDTFNAEFYSNLEELGNLKNIKRIKMDSENLHWQFIETIIPSYVATLGDDSQLDKEVFSQLEMRYDFRYRVKLRETVFSKINYNIGRHRYVSKVLNDFFGSRVILPKIENGQSELNELLRRLSEKRIVSRYYTRSDGNYRATHCYFQSDNRYFPWELQIWDKSREKQNQFEHVRHVQERKTQKVGSQNV